MDLYTDGISSGSASLPPLILLEYLPYQEQQSQNLLNYCKISLHRYHTPQFLICILHQCQLYRPALRKSPG